MGSLFLLCCTFHFVKISLLLLLFLLFLIGWTVTNKSCNLVQLISLATQQANESRDKVLGQEKTTLLKKPANGEGSRIMSWRTILIQGRIQASFTLGKGKAGCLFGSWTFFWLVGHEVTGWYFGSQYHQPSVSNQSVV